MLVLTVEEVFGDLHLLVFLETSLDSVGNALGTLQVKLHVDLVHGSIFEVIHDFVLLLLGNLVIDLFLAVSASLESSKELSVLGLSSTLHLLGQSVLEILELVKEALLLAIVVLALGNPEFHLLTSL